MKVKVREHPVSIYYLTDDDAMKARKDADGELDYTPCFTTESLGSDGFAWNTCEEFEESYRDAFPDGGL